MSNHTHGATAFGALTENVYVLPAALLVVGVLGLVKGVACARRSAKHCAQRVLRIRAVPRQHAVEVRKVRVVTCVAFTASTPTLVLLAERLPMVIAAPAWSIHEWETG